MDIASMVVVVLGLILFEIVSSIDNAVINADVLSTMKPKARKWFLFWGLIIAVFAIRGLLPWAIVWAANPTLGPIDSLLAAFSSDASVMASVEASAPILLMAGGTFLLFIFFHWIFLEKKNFGLHVEKVIFTQGIWFYAIVSLILAGLVWFSLQINTMMAFGAVIGSTAFFITHGFKQNAEKAEENLRKKGNMSDTSKLLYLEVIDATFSIDGVLGAFAFTLSVPLIIIGNGIGAFVVRELTIRNIEAVKKFVYLKNGAMYSICILGIIMVADSFGYHIPAWLSPVATFTIIGYFLFKSGLTLEGIKSILSKKS